MCKMTPWSVWIGQSNENISGPAKNVQWSPSKTHTSCLMIILESSNVLIRSLQAPICNFSVITITNIWMIQQFQDFWNTWVWQLKKKTGFRVVENSQKKLVSDSGKPWLETLMLTKRLQQYHYCPYFTRFTLLSIFHKIQYMWMTSHSAEFAIGV